MTHVSLFTGIGGLDLAAEAVGIETVLQVEREPYALRILERHWPNVPRITDVRDVTRSSIDGPVTVVSGGFPCQPFSAAGKRRGSDDDRYLWPELLRIVEELQPSWVVGENVSGLLSIDDGMEIDRLLASLEAANYEPWVLHYPAAGVGAYHKRDRVFIVAHARDKSGWDGERREFTRDGSRKLEERKWADQTATTSRSGPTSGDVADTEGYGLQKEHATGCDYENPKQGFRSESTGGRGQQTMADAKGDGLQREHATGCDDESPKQGFHAESTGGSGQQTMADASGAGRQERNATGVAVRSGHDTRRDDQGRGNRSTQSGMGRVAHGLPDWMDGEPAGVPRVATGIKDRAARLKTLGNAVVPAQAYPIFAAIAQVEKKVMI